MKEFARFNLGSFGPSILEEIKSGMYDIVKELKDGDVLVDLGASTGIISFFAAQQANLSQIIMVEPYPEYVKLIKQNFKDLNNWALLEKCISNKTGKDTVRWNEDPLVDSITFKDFVNSAYTKNYTKDKIDLLKIDIEGAEYHVFTDENVDYLNNNVKHIICEFHLSPADKTRFRNFRDNILDKINKPYEVRSIDGVDIKWDLRNDHFLEYYNCVIFTWHGNV